MPMLLAGVTADGFLGVVGDERHRGFDASVECG